ncbi:MAG: BatD family protein [Bacteroidetes bacterium]|nr:BatD family protein [Bacteroidota bacterium]
MTRQFFTKWFGCVFLLALVGAGVTNAQQVDVRSSVNATTIGTEEALTYTITVDGSDGSNIQIPPAPASDGLALLQTVPGTQQSVSIVNGQMSRSFGFNWTYRPTRQGKATIAATIVKVGDREYHTLPIEVTVVPQDQRPARQRQTTPFDRIFRSPLDAPQTAEPPTPDDSDLFIRAIPSARSAWQNEQVIVEYRLYFREGIQLRQSRLTDSWDAEGFWREELDVETRPIPRITVENGLRYNTIVLKRAAVFPTRAGEMSVDPLKIESEAMLPFGSRDPMQSLFSLGTRFSPVQLASPKVTIESKPLPDGAPSSFNGAVGSYAMTVTPDRTSLDVGESLQLTVTITGQGNLATLDAPRFDIPAAFEMYDPDVSSLLDRSGSRLGGSKTFRYVLIPRTNGTFEIPPVQFSWFDPGTGRYRTTSANPIPVTVTGTATAPDVITATTNGMPVDDFAPAFKSAGSWYRLKTVSLHDRLWTWLLVLLPVLVLGGAIVWQKRSDRYQNDVRWARGRRAHPLSRKHLKQAMETLRSGDTRGYFEELERAVLGFVGNRMNVAEKGLTRPQLDDLLADRQVSEPTRNRLRHFLETCDRGRFAPASFSPENKEEAFDLASSIIPDIDEEVGE